MENEGLFRSSAALSWQLSDALPPPELNSGPPADQPTPPSYLNPNWDQSIDPSVHFESALSSLVSSPSAAESLIIRELIGRLGSICNSGEISPTSRYHSTNTSCYSSPLNSPPKLNLSMIDTQRIEQGDGGLRPILGGPPPVTHLAPFSADPDFAERAARFSCFGGRRSYSSGLTAQFGPHEAGKLSRVSSSQSPKTGGTQMGAPGNEISKQSMFDNRLSESSTPDDGELGCSGREELSASGQITTCGEAGSKTAGESNARKRKAAPKGKGRGVPLSSTVNPSKVAEEEDAKAKRCSRSSEINGAKKDLAVKPKAENNGGVTTIGDVDKSSEINGAKKDLAVKPKGENNGGVTTIGDVDKKQPKNAKPLEPPKDYIHVRARRGQATDSHSLAERVRREKISDRMKFLQDLVPGCNKVTGKAAMLDEIINYVQSLQRQVEYLSMKLAAVNTHLDFNTESFIPKEMNQACGRLLPHSVYPLETTSMAFSCAHQPQGTPLQTVMTNGFETQYSMNSLDGGLQRSLSMQLPVLDGFGAATSQCGTVWDDDLESVVQMGSGQNAEAAFSSQSFHGRLNG